MSGLNPVVESSIFFTGTEAETCAALYLLIKVVVGRVALSILTFFPSITVLEAVTVTTTVFVDSLSFVTPGSALPSDVLLLSVI